MKASGLRPQDPFPYLIRPHALRRHTPQHPRERKVSTRLRKIIASLANGARLLLDIEQKRALLYSVRHGIKHLAELTVRTISDLVKLGVITVSERQGRLVHYQLTGIPLS